MEGYTYKMEKRVTFNKLVLAFSYVILPLFAYKVKLLFLLFFILAFILIKHLSNNNLYFIFNSYIFASSFFGVSIVGIKFFDIVIIFAWIYLLVKRKITVFDNSFYLICLFFIYDVFVYIFINLMRIPNNIGGYIELARYVFAFLALIIFSQQCFKRLEPRKLINSINYLGIILIFQTLVMSLCHSVFGALENFRSGIFTIDTFNYEKANAFTQNMDTEARVSAFFSDPNKLMAFFFCLLFLKKYISRNKNFDREDFIYLLGALVTGARTALIVVFFYVIAAFISSYLYDNQVLGYSLLIISTIIVCGILAFNNLTVTETINNVMNKALVLFGRQRTLAIDSNVSSDGRVIIWKQSIEYIKEHVLFGNGLLSEAKLLPYPTHNTIVQLLLDTGMIGFILFALGIARIVWKSGYLNYFVILIIIPALFLDLANYNFIYFALGMVAGINDVVLKKEHKNENLSSWSPTKG